MTSALDAPATTSRNPGIGWVIGKAGNAIVLAVRAIVHFWNIPTLGEPKGTGHHSGGTTGTFSGCAKNMTGNPPLRNRRVAYRSRAAARCGGA